MVSKLCLELPQLLLGKGRPLLAGLAAALWFPSVLLVVWGERGPNRRCEVREPQFSFFCPQAAEQPFPISLIFKDAEKEPMLSLYLLVSELPENGKVFLAPNFKCHPSTLPPPNFFIPKAQEAFLAV